MFLSGFCCSKNIEFKCVQLSLGLEKRHCLGNSGSPDPGPHHFGRICQLSLSLSLCLGFFDRWQRKRPGRESPITRFRESEIARSRRPSKEPRARQSQGLDETLLYQPHTLSRSGEREVLDLVETDLCCENLVLANTRAS